jgi:hypothetical protein
MLHEDLPTIELSVHTLIGRMFRRGWSGYNEIRISESHCLVSENWWGFENPRARMGAQLAG